MAVGDRVGDIASVAQNGYLTAQPASTIEWVIHNISAADIADVSVYDGTDELVIYSFPSGGGWLSNLQIHVNNAQYLRVKQLNAAAKVCWFDGVVFRT